MAWVEFAHRGQFLPMGEKCPPLWANNAYMFYMFYMWSINDQMWAINDQMWAINDQMWAIFAHIITGRAVDSRGQGGLNPQFFPVLYLID